MFTNPRPNSGDEWEWVGQSQAEALPPYGSQHPRNWVTQVPHCEGLAGKCIIALQFVSQGK